MSSEFRNKLVVLGNQVVFGMLSASRAVESIAGDRDLQNLSDGQLETLILEADRYWRDMLDIAVHRPENVAIYPILIYECARVRLQAIGRFRAGQEIAEQKRLDSRFDHWLTLETNCLIAKAMALLLLPQSQGAWNAFTEAGIHARALPDLDRPRLREMLWAAYGQGIAAMQGGQQSLYEEAQKALNDLFAYGEELAIAFLEEIEVEFNRFISTYERRMELLSGASSVETEASNHEESPDSIYLSDLNDMTHKVIDGHVSLDAARLQILERAHSLKLSAKTIYLVSVSHHNLGYIDPDVAATAAELNYAAATYLSGDLAEDTRFHCKLVLGTTLANKARHHQNEKGIFHLAIPHLEEALLYLTGLNNPEDLEKIGIGLNLLAVCYRGIDDFPKAADANREAINFWENLLPDPYNLGAAYGNLADVLEQMGEANAAFDNHYKAFQLFMQAKNIRLAREALEFLTQLSVQVGRIDDAVAALEQLVELMAEVSDVANAVKSLHSLGEYLMGVGHITRALMVFDRAETLLKSLLAERQPQREHLLLSVDAQVWTGAIYTMLLGEPSGRFTASEAHDILENARIQAYQLRDERRFAKTILQLMTLHYHTRSMEAVEDYNEMLDLIQLTPAESARREEILGNVKLLQADYIAAVEHLKVSMATYPPDQVLRKIILWNHLGEAYEAMGQFVDAVDAFTQAVESYEQTRRGLYEGSRIEFFANASEIYAKLIRLYTRPEQYDSVQALLWLERSKSRTFAETVGLANIPLPDPPTAIIEQLSQEQALLKKLSFIRNQLFIQPTTTVSDDLPLQHELHNIMEELNKLWDDIATYRPEYVELRRGASLNWENIQSLI